jgi:hypothetical protein
LLTALGPRRDPQDKGEPLPSNPAVKRPNPTRLRSPTYPDPKVVILIVFPSPPRSGVEPAGES